MEYPKESKDIVEKEFEAFPDVAADIINALLYGGEPRVEAANLLSAPTESIYQGAERLRNQYQDLTKYEMRSGGLNMIYQFANQTDVDSRMILRKAGYVGAVYREQYGEKLPDACPVVEIVLYWGEKPWDGAKSIRGMFDRGQLASEIWQYIDDLKLHVWEMRHLPRKLRERFTSDMRIVADYLAEGNQYRSDRRVVHKEALVKMIRVLSGERDVEDTAAILREMEIGEEDEVTVCELFDQYERKGISQGIRAVIATCKDFNASFDMTAAKIKECFRLSDEEVQNNMKLYW